MAGEGGVRFEFIGLKEVERALAQLPKAVSKSVLRAALKKIGQPIVATARGKAPRSHGTRFEGKHLADTIEIRPTLSRRQRRRRGPSRGAVELFIGHEWPSGAHGHLVEFGTSKMAAQPHLRPAWDAHQGRILPEFGRLMWQELQKAIRRLAKRAAAGKLSVSQQRELL